jgi:hypothetical protein
MKPLRRALLALVLSAGLAPAFAQVPAPVPALPDTERRQSYAITASTCACAVNFALYGDSTDYQNWIEVFLNGTRVNYNDSTFGWTITSPSGSLASIARPVTNAVLTFNSAQTGTVQIVGARRPRRTSQFNEGGGVPTRNFNVVLSDIISQNREIWDKTNDVTGRSILAPPGETLRLLAAASARASTVLGFDALGNITTYSPVSGVTSASNVTFLQPGGIAQTVQNRLAQTYFATDYAGIDPTGLIDNGPGIRAAIQLIPNGSKLLFPAGQYLVNSCVNNAVFDFSPTTIRDRSITIEGTGWSAGNPGGTAFLLGPSIPDDCDFIRRAGANNVFGTVLKNFAFYPSTGFYGAGVGRHGIHITATGQPDYFEYKTVIDHVFIGNMKTGQSFKTFSSPNASIIAGISSTTMTVASVSSGTIFVGGNVVNTSGVIIARVTALGSGTGGAGTYTITPSQTVAPGTALIALGNNGGGGLNNAMIKGSVFMSVNMKNVGDSITFKDVTVGQNELRGDPGYRWDQVGGATSVRLEGGLIANVNGMVVIDGGVFPSITGNVEFEMGNVANTQGCLIDVTGATSQVLGGLIDGNTISQNSSVGTVYPSCVRNAENIKIVSNRIATTAATPPHVLNTAASVNLSFNGNYCTTNGVTADCAALNSSSSINSQKVNIGTIGGSDPLTVLGFATVSGLHMVPGIFTFQAPPSGGGQFRFSVGTNLDMTLTGCAGCVLQQSTLGGPLTVGVLSGAAAGSLTGTTLASNVVNSSLTTFGINPALSSPVISGTASGNNTIPIAVLGQTAANTMLANFTGSTGSWASFAMPSCSDSGGNHVNYVSGTGITCGTSTGAAAAGTLTGATLAAGVTASSLTSFGTGPTLNGPAISGTASGANTLPISMLGQTAANTVMANATSGTANWASYSMSSCSSSSSALIWTTNTGFGCNTSIAASTATTATNATNTAITDDTTTNATVYPTWVTAATGNLPQKVSSTKYTFNPSTGVLTAPSFSGAGTGLTGTAASLTAGTASAVAASALTGSTLAAGVTASSLTSVGTLTGGATGASFTVALSTSTVTGNLPAANMDNTAWPSFTPSPTCGTATWTVTSAAFKTWGKVTHWSMDLTITAIGSCTGGTFTWTLPNTPQTGAGGGGDESAVSAIPVGCKITASTTAASCQMQTALALNNHFTLSGIYQNQ